MTTEKLKQYYILPLQIDVLKIQLENLIEESESIVPELSDMPHNPNASSRVEKYSTRIHDLEKTIKENEALYQEIHKFLYSISNKTMQSVFITRYSNDYDWEEVANLLSPDGEHDAKYYEQKARLYLKEYNKRYA